MVLVVVELLVEDEEELEVFDEPPEEPGKLTWVDWVVVELVVVDEVPRVV